MFVQQFLGNIFADRGMKKVMIKVTLHQLNTKTSTLLIHCSNLQLATTLLLFGYTAMLKVKLIQCRALVASQLLEEILLETMYGSQQVKKYMTI